MVRVLRSFSLIFAAGLVAALHGCACGPQAPGAACDPNAEEACQEGSVCVEIDDGHQCRVSLGQDCDPEADEPYCVDGAGCFSVGEAGECRVSEGNGCAPDDEYCAPGLVCENVEGGDAPNECHPPLLIEGNVRDASEETPIEGALVLALDERSAPVTDVAVSDADGNYSLPVPVTRDAEGRPLDEKYTLRASAQDYQTFPGGVRTALPLDTSLATKEDGKGYVIAGGLADILLLALPDAEQGLASIEGTVKAAAKSGGVLVLAEGAAATRGAISDRAGSYVIFNVPAGAYTVRGYRAGLQLEPEDVSVDDEGLTGVDLSPSSDDLATVSGSIQGVDGVGSRPTSVVLVVESTFNDVTERGEVPLGLRTDKTITGDWSIGEVPSGRYVVLAAYENDLLVRDPDTAISGTELLRVDVGAGDAVDAGSFKVTVALEILSPGAEVPEAVTDPPTFTWVDDSSESGYDVVVYDSFGDITWETSIPSVSGGNVALEYGGDPLEPGVYYQFRATSFRTPGGNKTPASRTEDLRGVFYLAE